MSKQNTTFRDSLKSWSSDTHTPTANSISRTSSAKHRAFADSLKSDTSHTPIAPKSAHTPKSANPSADGGRERGDDSSAPLSQGRSSDLKAGDLASSPSDGHAGSSVGSGTDHGGHSGLSAGTAGGHGGH